MTFSYLVIAQIEKLGSELGANPIKIFLFYMAAAAIGVIVYLAIEYQDEKEREKVLRILRVVAFVHRICPLCVLAGKYRKSGFSKMVRLWGKVCPFCVMHRIVRRNEFR